MRPLTPRYGPGFNIVTVIVPLHVIAHWQFDSYQFTSEVTDVTKFEADRRFNTAVICDVLNRSIAVTRPAALSQSCLTGELYYRLYAVWCMQERSIN